MDYILFLPIIAAILQSASAVLDKIILSFNHVHYKTYVSISFPLIFIIDLAIFLMFQPPLSLSLLSGNLLWLFIISIIIIISNNLLYYRALDNDYLKEIQTLDLLSYIPMIIFTSIIFSDERNFYIIIPAFVASSAIIWSHWQNHHFAIRKRTLPLFLFSLIIAPIRAAIQKILLFSWNPISLEVMRIGFVALILNPFSFGRHIYQYIKRIQLKVFLLLIATNILTSVAFILYFFSIKHSGIIYTALSYSLYPLLVYLGCVFILKEPSHWKKNLAFFIVLISITIAQIIK